MFIGQTTNDYFLAYGLGVKTIGLYLPLMSYSSFRWGPFHLQESEARILIPEVVCGEQDKCTLHKCPYYQCMERIETSEVLSQTLKMIN